MTDHPDTPPSPPVVASPEALEALLEHLSETTEALHAVTAARDEALGAADYLQSRIAVLEPTYDANEMAQRIGMLTEMLRRLADHQVDCPAFTVDHRPIHPRCTCGLSDALRAGSGEANEWRRIFWERDDARARGGKLEAAVTRWMVARRAYRDLPSTYLQSATSAYAEGERLRQTVLAAEADLAALAEAPSGAEDHDAR